MHQSLAVVLVLLASGVLVVTLFRRLNLPPMLGYLLAGVAIGPHALGLVHDSAETLYLAEFGVVFLMFSIGLEFSLPQLVAMRHVVLGFGLAQVLVTMALVIAVALALSVDWKAGVALGGIFAMSSTAIVSKTLSERLQLHSTHGRQIMGVLLLQDLAVVPLLVLVPALAAGGAALATALGIAALKATALLALLLFFGQRAMRWLFNQVAARKSSELFVLTVLLVTLGLASATAAAGLSLALGAFVAGILISETEYRYQVEDYIKPFRDVLLGLFFVTIGMMLDMRVVTGNLLGVLAALLVLLVAKLAIIYGLARGFGNNTAVGLRCALALSPAGEFGFVLLSQAVGLHLLPVTVGQVTLAAMLLSMLVAPFLLAYSDRIVLYFSQDEWMQRAMAIHDLSVKSMATQGHVIICGYGRSGQALARFLETEKIPVIALDMDPERVRMAAGAGDSVVFGDAGRREVLIAAGLARASALVVSFSDLGTALRILSHTRELRPELPVIVRTIEETDIDTLKDAGAAEVVPEVVEGSLMLASHAMLMVGVPLARVLAHIREFRGERYRHMRAFFHGRSDVEAALEDPQAPRLTTLLLEAGAAAIGRSIRELGLAELRVEITAIRRRNLRDVNPAEDQVLEAGDVVILLGAPENLAAAEIRLLQG